MATKIEQNCVTFPKNKQTKNPKNSSLAAGDLGIEGSGVLVVTRDEKRRSLVGAGGSHLVSLDQTQLSEYILWVSLWDAFLP